MVRDMKNIVREVLEEDIDVYGRIQDVIVSLKELEDKYPDHDLELRQDGGWDTNWVNLIGYRSKTEEEKNTEKVIAAEKAKRKENARLRRIKSLQNQLEKLQSNKDEMITEITQKLKDLE